MIFAAVFFIKKESLLLFKISWILDIGIRYSTLEGFFIKELSSGVFCVNMISDVLKFFDLLSAIKAQENNKVCVVNINNINLLIFFMISILA
ncbi:hypothetical protein BBU29805_0900 [Borreliella burgdorferi 29805]|nr:hypothetical protein BBU29805_0900 [Borreliella burgdorferi 29805]